MARGRAASWRVRSSPAKSRAITDPNRSTRWGRSTPVPQPRSATVFCVGIGDGGQRVPERVLHPGCERIDKKSPRNAPRAGSSGVPGSGIGPLLSPTSVLTSRCSRTDQAVAGEPPRSTRPDHGEDPLLLAWHTFPQQVCKWCLVGDSTHPVHSTHLVHCPGDPIRFREQSTDAESAVVSLSRPVDPAVPGCTGIKRTTSMASPCVVPSTSRL